MKSSHPKLFKGCYKTFGGKWYLQIFHHIVLALLSLNNCRDRRHILVLFENVSHKHRNSLATIYVFQLTWRTVANGRVTENRA